MDSPTGDWAPPGACGVRGCPNPAAYVATFSDWPPELETGACVECAPRLRMSPNLTMLRTYRA